MKFDTRIFAMTVGLGNMVVGMQASAVAASLPENRALHRDRHGLVPMDPGYLHPGAQQ
jgi:hypothetical protein